ncbi:hypothetical protein F7725_002811 [Dissostichus mawsoni]|uniref:Uncharacterized protein n=1 Tax=Dissostichus mawsoni TaxID=36200 RepID=A0A7J5Y998_DISMA|nr:hypothetical protein F7725_002811 [Dissostichus mawsoni]
MTSVEKTHMLGLLQWYSLLRSADSRGGQTILEEGDEEDTEEEEGSAEDRGREMEVGPQLAVDDEQGGEARESGEDSLVSRRGAMEGGGVCGGEEEGGSTLVEEEEEEEEEEHAVNLKTPAFSLVFLARRRRRLVVRDDEGEEAEEEVDVMELALVFLDFSPEGLDNEDCGAARLLRFPILAISLLRDRGSEHGLRNGDLLSLSLQKTTAIEPPTTELPVPPPVPPGPMRSMPSFPEHTEAPVVLLTPSRTSTDTFD